MVTPRKEAMRRFLAAGFVLALVLQGQFAYAGTPALPEMTDYNHLPIFQTTAVAPNILVILDNSGSMNYNAYGSPRSYGDEVPEPFNGPPFCGTKSMGVSASQDDWEEQADQSSYSNQVDLDIGERPVAVRFDSVDVPQGRTVTSAYIQFTCKTTLSTATSAAIWGEAADHSPQYDGSDAQASGRPKTAASVSWNSIPAWTSGQQDADTATPDLTAVVQEIVNRPGWQSGNAMTFIILPGAGHREAYSYDGSSSLAPVLHIEFDYEPEDCEVYYGYFDPTATYTYDGNKFVRDATGAWDGNWLNWCCMRRVDVLRKVLVGGLATSRTGGGNTTLIGETPDQSVRYYTRHFNATGYTAYSGDYWYGVKDGYLYVDTDSNPFSGYAARLKIEVKKEEAAEPDDFYEGNIAGIMQRVGEKARWGNEWFDYGSGTNDEGGFIANRIGSNMTSLVTDMQNTGCATWTPLAESYYVAMKYFMQEKPETSLGYANGAIGAINATNDPFYTDQYLWCAKSFVILLTDGASTKDGQIPSMYKSYDGDVNENTACNEYYESNCDYPDGGTDYLDDLALYARTNDLRSDLESDQNIILYTVYAFGSDDNARNLLKDAAKNGGFIDKNGNDSPDLDEEWDEDGDGVPDTYFEAQDGYQLESELLAAITSILRRAASATAVSVLATRGEGEGSMVQAFFKPATTDIQEINWIGYLQSLWVDRYGNIREDSNHNYRLDLADDDIIRFFLDAQSGETMVEVYETDNGNPYNTTTPSGTKELEDIEAIWEGGEKLAQRAAATRKIFTSTGSSTHFVEFATDNTTVIGPYLGVNDTEATDSLTYLGSSYDDRVNNLICFTRGEDPAGSTCYQGAYSLRNRNDPNGNVWKLADIVDSTPVTVAKPMDNYGLLYDDQTYKQYFKKYDNRETVVYVGSNGGMLHAFTSGWYNADNQSFQNVYNVSGYLSDIPDSIVGNIDIGEEMWAYIPKNLLPHLKWLASTAYDENNHVDMVDLTSKVVDARVFSDDTKHPGGWGTVLVGGMRMGGGEIMANGQTFRSTYFAIDITNPRDPELMWELDPAQFPNLGYTVNSPCVLSVGNEWNNQTKEWSSGQWFLALGSGPTDYDGGSTQSAHVYILDLSTGAKLRDITASTSNSFVNSPVAFDKAMNYNVDGIYYAVNYDQGGWKSLIQKITIPQDNTEFNPLRTNYDDNVNNWYVHNMIELQTELMTAPFTLSNDRKGNAWIFAGTGKYMSQADKISTEQHYLYGIKDPFFNYEADNRTNCYAEYGKTCQADPSRLYDAGQYEVYEDQVTGLSGGSTFNDLLEEARDAAHDGWYRELCAGSLDGDGNCLSSGPTERVLNKPAILGGVVLVPTFAPSDDPCGFGGYGRLFAVYYETGTAYRKSVVGQEGNKILDVIPLGEGLSSSFGIHVGQEEGGMVFGQLSTGVIQQFQVVPALRLKSAPVYWKEEQ